MKKICSMLPLLMLALILNAQSVDENTYVKLGDQAPVFKVKTLEGKIFDLEKLKGKIVYINFFATWCGPCMKEMPHIEEQIWKKIKHDDFILIAIGREHSEKELKSWLEKKKFTLPFAADSDRAIYKLYAKQMIPRNYVIGKDGKIIYQNTGYSEEEFSKMIELIKSALN